MRTRLLLLMALLSLMPPIARFTQCRCGPLMPPNCCCIAGKCDCGMGCFCKAGTCGHVSKE